MEPSRKTLDSAAPAPHRQRSPSGDPPDRRVRVGGVRVDGKHFALRGEPYRLCGVTYGSFRRRSDGALFPEQGALWRDFRAMADAGVNVVRLYTAPPENLLEAAEAFGLRLIVGLDYHDWRLEQATDRAARRRIVAAGHLALDRTLETCAGRAGVLAVAVGNEVPVDLVRLHGAHHVEETLSELVERVHAADDNMLATYVNFPTTEFLEVDGQDFVSFNVFLENPEALRRYLRHLQIVAGSKPLVLTEIGLAAAVHGEEAQAESIAWQLALATESGCAGACVFSWTDEWAVDDKPVDGWGFGLTTAERRAKPALGSFQGWAGSSLRDARTEWPRISVVVCAHNEERTIEECLRSLCEIDYPELEVIVCVDGSGDRTLDIASTFPFQVIDLPHGGLSKARNWGLAAASGEIVAYLDADAACHPHWLYHLALSLEEPDVVATGGPNLPFPGAGAVEQAVALAPGDPVEVLIADDRAEHVPGCNMAFRTDELRALGGFNVACTAAGDDVDVCWRLLDRQQQIGFAPAAQVRHHRRDSVRRYLRQQVGYGRAEKMLSGAHPHRFNGLGQAKWTGFVYSRARLLPSLLAPVVYHGYQGLAPFQPIKARPAQAAIGWVGAHLPVLLPIALAGALLGLTSPLWLAVPAACVLVAALYAAAVCAGLRGSGSAAPTLRARALAGLLHVAQPVARLWGRVRGRKLEPADREAAWWGDRAHWLEELERELELRGARVSVGGPTQSWDLEARRGIFVTGRISTAVVWSWEPRLRLRWRPRPVALAWLAASLTALPMSVVPAVAALGLGTALMALELLALRRRISAAVEASTVGARREAIQTPRGGGAATERPRDTFVFDSAVFSTRDGLATPRQTSPQPRRRRD